MREISEADWRIFRRLHLVARQRFCEHVLLHTIGITLYQKLSPHEAYLELSRAMRKYDKECAKLFDDSRRSTALLQLAALRSAGWVCDEDLARFSEETRATVSVLRRGN